MARPLRIMYEGAIYHVTSRGNARQNVFLSDEDRLYFLTLLGQIVERYGWICHAYCLMNNHYHLLIETRQGNLPIGMRQLNGVYTQRFNREHKRIGHLFQGRYKAIHVQKGSHLLELCRYVVLNPVRAKMVSKAVDYGWSSYRATLGQEAPANCLKTDWLLAQFGTKRRQARRLYERYVAEGIDDRPWERLKGQIYYGSDDFVEGITKDLEELTEIPRQQKHPFRPSLEDLLRRPQGVLVAYRDHGYRLKEIADHLGVHYVTVSRRLRHLELKV